MLLVQKLDPRATLPTVAHPGEDLGYDLYALEDVNLVPRQPQKVRTGIAVRAFSPYILDGTASHGLLIRDRSSLAAKGLLVSGGVVDAGYTGEIVVLMTYVEFGAYYIHRGDKIAQMLPIPILTGEVREVDGLGESSRGSKGFGSSGQ